MMNIFEANQWHGTISETHHINIFTRVICALFGHTRPQGNHLSMLTLRFDPKG